MNYCLVLSDVVKVTNRFAAEKIIKVSPLRKTSMWKTWKEVTLPDPEAFIGCLTNMEINLKLEIEDFSHLLDRLPTLIQRNLCK